MPRIQLPEASELRIGDTIVDGPRKTEVKRLVPGDCGIAKLHVNDNECYEARMPITVIRGEETK